jgi:hypothetical protein
MQNFFEQLIQFIQQGIGALFRFIQFIWIWSVGQITALLSEPWQEWPLNKQVALLIVLVIVGWVLYYAYRDLWAAGQAIVAAFGTLLSALLRTLPRILIAGLIALGAIWVLNKLPEIRLPDYGFNGSDR